MFFLNEFCDAVEAGDQSIIHLEDVVKVIIIHQGKFSPNLAIHQP
jgi:hypothetical protein